MKDQPVRGGLGEGMNSLGKVVNNAMKLMAQQSEHLSGVLRDFWLGKKKMVT